MIPHMELNSMKKQEIEKGLSGIIIDVGYMEYLDIPQLLKENGITEKVIFYGVEDITTKNPFLRIYAFLKKISPSFVTFYRLPYNKLHGVATRLELIIYEEFIFTLFIPFFH